MIDQKRVMRKECGKATVAEPVWQGHCGRATVTKAQ